MPEVVESKDFIWVDIKENRNRWYHIELHSDGKVLSRYGRVGQSGQMDEFPSGGHRLFDSKVREKLRKGYQPQETVRAGVVTEVTDLATVAKRDLATTCPIVTALIERLASENVHRILSSTNLSYDTSKGTFSTPLGLVTQSGINKARTQLVTIADHVERGDYDSDEFYRAVEQYFMLVPQNVGQRKPDLRLLYPDKPAVLKQNDILDGLEASLASVVSTASGDKVFDLRLWVEEDSVTLKDIEQRYYSSINQYHASSKLKIKKVYGVESQQMVDRFELVASKLGNVKRLWHGTSSANILSILKNGLRCTPPDTASIAGKAFDAGIYFSTQSTKSLNYSFGYWSGVRRSNCFMLSCDVCMGREFLPGRGDSKPYPKPGYDSTYAKAGVIFMNEELIVYRDDAVCPRYLVEFEE